MKIAVYTIALNEEQFVTRWYESAKQADYLLIADTGSTDGTVELAKSLGIHVIDATTKPWRFDVARNKSLDALPEDIDWCICLDMDEIMIDGWREHIENAKPESTRLRYQYTWNWKPDGSPGLMYGGDKIHKRHGYRWKHPVHEVMMPSIPEVQEWVGLEIHHHADNTKSRSSYLPLLKMSVEEDPDDDRNAFYYARELFSYGRKEEAAEEFKRHLALPRATWRPERAASYRYLAKCEPDKKVHWLNCAVAEAYDRREPYIELAQHYFETEDWLQCLRFCDMALRIKEKPLEYLCEDFAWGSIPYDLASIACWHLGLRLLGKRFLDEALELDPDNERLINNKRFFNGL